MHTRLKDELYKCIARDPFINIVDGKLHYSQTKMNNSAAGCFRKFMNSIKDRGDETLRSLLQSDLEELVRLNQSPNVGAGDPYYFLKDTHAIAERILGKIYNYGNCANPGANALGRFLSVKPAATKNGDCDPCTVSEKLKFHYGSGFQLGNNASMAQLNSVTTYLNEIVDIINCEDGNYNSRPVANAGSDLTLTTASAILDGSKSTDPDGTIKSYAWSKISGPNATIAKNKQAKTTVTLTADGTYVFQLTVTDNEEATNSDTVQIIKEAKNIGPIANAGAETTTTETSITLDGSKSTDPDGTIKSYVWRKTSGPNATIAKSSQAKTTVTLTTDGIYIFQLTVTDNDGATNSDTVRIIKEPKNIAPVANAGADITTTETSVTLDGSKSLDADGTIKSYAWSKISGPQVTIVNSNLVKTTVALTSDGTYVFQLTVTDNDGATNNDTVKVTKEAKNIGPIANAGPDITTTERVVPISGSQSTDADGTITSYVWSKVSGPRGSIVDSRQAKTRVSLTSDGTYIFQLTVTDNDGATNSDTITIIKGPANVGPTANAGADSTTTEDSVLISGVKSTDPDGTIKSYAWSQVSGPKATISKSNQASTAVALTSNGTYVFQLTVTDNDEAANTDTVKIIKTAANVEPTANAGSDVTTSVALSTLDGSKSTDPDGTIKSYAWSKTLGPKALIKTSNQSKTMISLTSDGTYVFQLTVTDNDGASNSDTVKIIKEAKNIGPKANAGTDITTTETTVQLDGSKSNDPDGTIKSYVWSQESGPKATISRSNVGHQAKVTLSSKGAYVFKLTVTDNDGATNSDTIKVTKMPQQNTGPIANAGSDSTTTGTRAFLNGSKSTDPDGIIARYSWIQRSGPEATITDGNKPMATASLTTNGTYVFQLTVTDNKGDIDRDTVTVTKKPQANTDPLIANAGSDLTTQGIKVILDGSKSKGSIKSYKWTRKPESPNATIINEDKNRATAILTGNGRYFFQLRITGYNGATRTDTVMVFKGRGFINIDEEGVGNCNCNPNTDCCKPCTTGAGFEFSTKPEHCL